VLLPRAHGPEGEFPLDGCGLRKRTRGMLNQMAEGEGHGHGEEDGESITTKKVTSKHTNVLLCFIIPRVRKIGNETSSYPGIFSRTLHFYYVASSPGSPLPHLLDGHRKLVGSSAIPARSCPGPVWYHWGSIVELEVPPDET